jgi:hypothetical protein
MKVSERKNGKYGRNITQEAGGEKKRKKGMTYPDHTDQPSALLIRCRARGSLDRSRGGNRISASSSGRGHGGR